MNYFKIPRGFVAGTLLAAVMSFSAAVTAAPVVIYASGGTTATGINDIEIAGFGTYDVTFSGYWIEYFSDNTTGKGALYTYDFALAASSSLFDLLDGGSLDGSSLDLAPLGAVGCVSGGSCTMHTPWDYEQLASPYSALLHSQFVTNSYQAGGDSDSWTNGFDYSAVGSAGPAYAGNNYIPVTWNLDSSLYLTWTEASAPSAVPIPAAAFMFAPALLGFLGFRRKLRA